MSFEQINGLIQDWKQGRKRRFQGRTFASRPKEYQWFVARVAAGFLPQIREFVTAEETTRKAVLKAWRRLVADLEEDLRMLDVFDPTGKTQFFAAYVITHGILGDKAAVKAFEQSQVGPVDEFGNSVFISGIAASLDTILDQTFHALRGMTGKDLHSSLLRRASQGLQNALAQGLVKAWCDVTTLLLPQLGIVEMELEKIHFRK
ncbi:MAG: hypothetical protein ACFE9D_12560 [Promethearchaeota archaeon]